MSVPDADAPTPTNARSWAAERMIGAIVWYQRQMEGRPSPCRFFPSCSEYALDAVAGHGARRGGWLTVRRLVRCRPFGPSGYDPVPDRRDARRDACSDECPYVAVAPTDPPTATSSGTTTVTTTAPTG